MKFLQFVLKHLRRNWVRTLSTVVAMAMTRIPCSRQRATR